MANRTKWTLKKERAFLEALRETSNVSLAARAVSMSRSGAYERRSVNPDFAAAWDEAVDEATDTLEREARRRALEGTLKPVFYQGEEVGHIREYSDTLMIVLLKAHRPEKYKDRVEQEHSGKVDSEITITRKIISVSKDES